MPSPDTLAAIAMVAAMFLAAWVICRTEPGGAVRLLGGEHTGRRVRPAGTPRPVHAKPLHSHAAPRGFVIDAESSTETAAGEAGPDTFPWAVPSALATIPDPLTIARTA
jgi:hypothetical protein